MTVTVLGIQLNKILTNHKNVYYFGFLSNLFRLIVST